MHNVNSELRGGTIYRDWKNGLAVDWQSKNHLFETQTGRCVSLWTKHLNTAWLPAMDWNPVHESTRETDPYELRFVTETKQQKHTLSYILIIIFNMNRKSRILRHRHPCITSWFLLYISSLKVISKYFTMFCTEAFNFLLILVHFCNVNVIIRHFDITSALKFVRLSVKFQNVIGKRGNNISHVESLVHNN